MTEVKNGSKVKVHYTGTFEDGTTFDSSKGREPLEFTVGEGKVIKGFEEALVGMKEGEDKTVKLEPKDAYGVRNEEMIRPFPKDKLPQGQDPKPGMMLSLKSPDGKVFPAKINKVEGDQVFLDFNHPLAGKVLNFKLKIEKIE